MRVDLSKIDPNQFMVHQHFVGDIPVVLVQPVHIGCEWLSDSMIFRSSVWDLDGNPVSLSFKKFFNWGEKPHLTPVPLSLSGAHLMEKIDGSTLIFSRYKGHTVIRTRGTVNARTQENGYEIDYLCEKYSKFMDMLNRLPDSEYSYLFEWTSPTNRIVLNYGDEPDMTFIGTINHFDYSYTPQHMLDAVASKFDLRRPRTYSYNSIEEMQKAVEDFRGVEGVCVYFHDDQKILKVKGAQYLYLHRAKSEIASIEKVMDVYLDFFFNSGSNVPPTYQEFFAYLEKIFDFEIATMATSNSSQICDAMKEVVKILASLKKTVASCAGLSRKQAAYTILQSYGNSGRSSMMFKLLDGKTLDKDDYKKLLFQILKK